MAARLLAADTLEPKLTPAKAAAYVIAGLVHLLTLGFLLLGVALIVLGFPNVFALVFGAISIGMAILLRPRLGKAPDEGVLSRSDAPTLYGVADEVAASLGIQGIDMLVVDHEFNASWSVVGIRRRRVMSLGLPLLQALSPQERIALIAHELAHARNGDARRGFFVGSAVNALAELYWIVAPEDLPTEALGGFGILERAANGFFYVFSRPLWWLLLLELHLLLRDAQRAEYLADALAARAAGTDAVVALSEKILLEPTFRAVVQHAARPGMNEDLFETLRTTVERIPDRERERRRRAARLEAAELIATHPPTAKRIALLEGRPRVKPAVPLTDERSAAIDEELAARRRALQEQLVDDHRHRLYQSDGYFVVSGGDDYF